MRKKLVMFVGFSLILLGLGGASVSNNVVTTMNDLPERDEVHQSYQLSPGAQVSLSHINGELDVQAIEGNIAYVDIVRSANNRADFVYDTISIQQTPSELILRGANSKSGRIEVRQRVSLRLPLDSNFAVNEVNGSLDIGPIQGNVNIRGVNGKLNLAQAASTSDVSSVNGHMTIVVSRLGDGGLRIRDAVSAVALRVADDLNANLVVKELDGDVSVNNPKVILNRVNESEYSGQIGSGGALISIIDVRGGLTIGSK
jgi:DUF4097 and DUF4098 domain-containing protein YvlB